MKKRLILLRHGQSLFNQKNRFTGWVDVPLSTQGIQEALEAGKTLKNIPIDVAYSSSLIRAQTTLFLALSQMHLQKTPIVQHPKGAKEELWGKLHEDLDALPIYFDARLNERMYGNLQGLDKEETKQKFGPEKVHEWRRSYHSHPPEGESLEDTKNRALPYFIEEIEDKLTKNNVFVVAHGNSLRAILMYIESLSEKEVVSLEIPTGKPLIYSFSAEKTYKKEAL